MKNKFYGAMNSLRCSVSGASSPGGKKSKISTGAIAGIAVAGGLLVIALIAMVLFALRQKRRANEAVTGRSDPFGKGFQKLFAFQFLLCYRNIFE